MGAWLDFLDRLFGRITPPEVKIEDVRGDCPRFKRNYRAEITNEISITITAYTCYGRNLSGELTQRDGKWVLFDPDRPADKILDKTLVPMIEAKVREIKRLDREYMNPAPFSFVDENGFVWERRGKV